MYKAFIHLIAIAAIFLSSTSYAKPIDKNLSVLEQCEAALADYNQNYNFKIPVSTLYLAIASSDFIARDVKDAGLWEEWKTAANTCIYYLSECQKMNDVLETVHGDFLRNEEIYTIDEKFDSNAFILVAVAIDEVITKIQFFPELFSGGPGGRAQKDWQQKFTKVDAPKSKGKQCSGKGVAKFGPVTDPLSPGNKVSTPGNDSGGKAGSGKGSYLPPQFMEVGPGGPCPIEMPGNVSVEPEGGGAPPSGGEGGGTPPSGGEGGGTPPSGGSGSGGGAPMPPIEPPPSLPGSKGFMDTIKDWFDSSSVKPSYSGGRPGVNWGGTFMPAPDADSLPMGGICGGGATSGCGDSGSDGCEGTGSIPSKYGATGGSAPIYIDPDSGKAVEGGSRPCGGGVGIIDKDELVSQPGEGSSDSGGADPCKVDPFTGEVKNKEKCCDEEKNKGNPACIGGGGPVYQKGYVDKGSLVSLPGEATAVGQKKMDSSGVSQKPSFLKKMVKSLFGF